jgi:hypothetical protein
MNEPYTIIVWILAALGKPSDIGKDKLYFPKEYQVEVMCGQEHVTGKRVLSANVGA